MIPIHEGTEPELRTPPRKVRYVGFWSVPVSTAICASTWLIISALFYLTDHSRNPLANTVPASSVVFIFVGLVYWVINWCRALATNLLKNGIATKATIINKQMGGRTRGGASYLMRYSFETGDVFPIEMQRDVGAKVWEALNIGDKATLLYDPRQPNKNVFYVGIEGGYKIG